MTDLANEGLHAVAARLERVADRLEVCGLPGGDDEIDPEHAYQQIATEEGRPPDDDTYHDHLTHCADAERDRLPPTTDTTDAWVAEQIAAEEGRRR